MPHSNNLFYEFGPFKLNVRERLLTRDGEAVALTPKSADILVVLLKNAGELVDKETLMTEVWPESFVEEANLTQNVFQLRRALGDQRTGAHYIETVARRGYRFVASVSVVESAGEQLDQNQEGRRRSDRLPRLAILPFVNASGDQDLEYLADGISENLINDLSQIANFRVMSRSAVFRFKGQEIDPKALAAQLRVDAILIGKISSRPAGLVVKAELVDGNGWRLWGGDFECKLDDIFEIQPEIVRQISATFKLTLTGDEEKRITARYTENSQAYQAYLEGRFHWSRYTREGIERAIAHFLTAIEHDPNYALAYSAVIDCFLRLATNYLPPEKESSTETTPNVARNTQSQELPKNLTDASDPKVTLRHEWDWKGAERELRRASELKVDFPVAHQWHAAYLFVRELYNRTKKDQSSAVDGFSDGRLPAQIRLAKLTPNEEAQVYCAIAREQIVASNFEGARLILGRWLTANPWPSLNQLDAHIAADLLLTLGTVTSILSITGPSGKGQKQAESYLSGSIALLEHLGRGISAAEARIELGRCYYREGCFDEAREMLALSLAQLPADQTELRTQGLVILAVVERDSGRLRDSLNKLEQAFAIEAGQLVTGRRHLEMATTLKELADSESNSEYFLQAQQHFEKALYEFEAIGNHHNRSVTENNFGNLLLSMGHYEDCESHLLHALQLFKNFSDPVRAAQVHETLTHLYLATQELSKAQNSIDAAVATLEMTDADAILAEALLTQGVVNAKLKRYTEAKKSFEGAHRLAERCGDNDGAGRALLSMFEELGERMEEGECLDLKSRLTQFLNQTQQSSLLVRMNKVFERIEATIDRN